VQVMDSDARAFLAGPAARGVPLRGRLAVALGAARALRFLHAQSPPAPHGRVRPACVLLAGQDFSLPGAVRLSGVGFGGARRAAAARSDGDGGGAAGGADDAYMAPEVRAAPDGNGSNGAAGAAGGVVGAIEGAAGDVYSLAVLAWELAALAAPPVAGRPRLDAVRAAPAAAGADAGEGEARVQLLGWLGRALCDAPGDREPMAALEPALAALVGLGKRGGAAAEVGPAPAEARGSCVAA
jgi:hypothetical protein